MAAAADLNKFLEKIQNLPQIKSKAAASLLGAAVADAAARPLHWIYDRDQLDSILGEKVSDNFVILISDICCNFRETLPSFGQRANPHFIHCQLGTEVVIIMSLWSDWRHLSLPRGNLIWKFIRMLSGSILEKEHPGRRHWSGGRRRTIRRRE